MLRFHLVTLFPEFFASPLATGLLGRFQRNRGVEFTFHNPRDYSEDRHRHVDDAPFGGGAGMVMQAAPVYRAARAIGNAGRIVLLGPAGRSLTPELAASLCSAGDITLICGRYEGIDARVGPLLNAEEISIGDFVLNGGETAALAVIEAVCRYAPGFLGKRESAEDESFSHGLLEYQQYTRPETFMGLRAPEVLTGGNHALIAAWRRKMSLGRTLKNRPDLLAKARLAASDAQVLVAMPLTRPGRNLSFCLMHWPVRLDDKRIGAASLTNLDIHDIARISHSYGMAAFYVLTPLTDQLRLVEKIVRHWQTGTNQDRAHALSLVKPVASFQEMKAAAARLHGVEPVCLAASAHWPEGNGEALAPQEVLELCRSRPVVICLGTARGLAPEALSDCDGRLKPVRFLGENHLSVRSAAAIIADRVLGDFN